MSSLVQPGSLALKDVCEMLFQSSAEGIAVIDVDGVILLVNPSLEKMFGYQPGELSGRKIETLIPVSLAEEHIKLRGKYTANPSMRRMGAELELFGERKNHQKIPLEISLNHFEIKGERVIMAVVMEISRRKKVTDQLKKERRTTQMYLDAVSTMFILVRKDHTVGMVNKIGCEMLGQKQKEILGKDWFQHFVPKTEREEMRSVFDQLMAGKGEKFKNYVNPILSKDGKEKLFVWNNIVIYEEDGTISGTLSSGIDITAQVQAEAELKRLNQELEQRVEDRTKDLEDSQQLYKMIVRDFPNGDINVLDEKLNYLLVSGTDFLLGSSGERLIGKNFLEQLDPELRPEVKKKLMTTFDGANVSFELKVGNKVYMINAAGLHTNGFGIRKTLLVSQNITKQKNAEEHIHRLLEKERRLNELKSRFVSMASHEFRTPLTSILNATSLLAKYIGTSGNEDKQQKHVSRVKNSIHHLIAILNDFLSLDKLEEGKLELNRSMFDLEEFVQDTVQELLGIAKKAQEIRYEHVGINQVYLDKQVVKNIFNNLLSNAIKYSPEGSIITVKTSIEQDTLFIVIKDQGIGIPKEEQGQLFERFFRAKNALNIPGTGLGLNIVKKYLDQAGGEISLESELNKGTVFTIRIPLE